MDRRRRCGGFSSGATVPKDYSTFRAYSKLLAQNSQSLDFGICRSPTPGHETFLLCSSFSFLAWHLTCLEVVTVLCSELRPIVTEQYQRGTFYVIVPLFSFCRLFMGDGNPDNKKF